MHTPKPLLALLLAASASMAQAEPLKIGLILPLTGPFASTGKQIEAGARLYMAQQGDTVADRKMLASHCTAEPPPWLRFEPRRLSAAPTRAAE